MLWQNNGDKEREDMNWTREMVEIYIAYYYQLQKHELKFWQETFSYRGEVAIRAKGTSLTAPFIPQADKNIEFEMAIKSLGKLGERVFRLRYLDGYGLEDINRRLQEPYRDIEDSFYSVKGKVINYLVRRG